MTRGFVKVITKLRFRRKMGLSEAWLIQAWWLTPLTPALVSKVSSRTFKAVILRNLSPKQNNEFYLVVFSMVLVRKGKKRDQGNKLRVY